MNLLFLISQKIVLLTGRKDSCRESIRTSSKNFVRISDEL